MKPMEEATPGLRALASDNEIMKGMEDFSCKKCGGTLETPIGTLQGVPIMADCPDCSGWIAPIIALTTVDALRRYAQDLFVAHVEECEPDMANDLAPDWETYERLEQEGRLMVLWAYHMPDVATMDPIGYAAARLGSPSHYSQRVFAQLDALYVAPEWRGRRIALKLIDALKKQSKVRGATRLLMHAKPGSRLAALLPRLGFVVEETIWRLEL